MKGIMNMKRKLLTTALCLLLVFASVPAAETASAVTLDLQTVQQLALANDSQMLTARKNAQNAEEAVVSKLAQIAPGCTVKADPQSSSADRISFSISPVGSDMALPRIISNAIASQIEQALWAQVDAEAKLAQTRISVTASVTQKYLQALQAEQNVALSQNALDIAREDARVTKAYLEAGTVLKLDVQKAESSSHQAEIQLEKAKASLRQAYDAMLLQICKPLGAAVTLAPVPLMSIAAEGDEDALFALALKNRAEVILARNSLRQAEKSLIQCQNTPGAENAANPSLSVTYDQASGDISWSVQGVSQAATATSDLEIARHDLTQTETQIRLDIRQRQSDLRLAKLDLEQAKSARGLAAETRRVAEVRYKEGMTLFTDLVQAAQSLAQADFNVAKAEFNILMAEVYLNQACGL